VASFRNEVVPDSWGNGWAKKGSVQSAQDERAGVEFLRTVKMLLEPPPSELHLADIGASDLLKTGRIVEAGWPEYILRPAPRARCKSCQIGLIGLSNGEPWAGSTSG
jgi:hypothetical protein